MVWLVVMENRYSLMCCSTAILVNRITTMAYTRLLSKKNQMTVIMTLVVLDLFHHRYHHQLILLHRQEILQQFPCLTHIHVIQALPAQVMVCLEKKIWTSWQSYHVLFNQLIVILQRMIAQCLAAAVGSHLRWQCVIQRLWQCQLLAQPQGISRQNSKRN